MICPLFGTHDLIPYIVADFSIFFHRKNIHHFPKLFVNFAQQLDKIQFSPAISTQSASREIKDALVGRVASPGK